MPLDLTALARQASQAAADASAREGDLEARVRAAAATLLARDWEDVCERVARRTHRPWLAGMPIEALADRHPAPPIPDDYTVVSTDGSHLDQDHHAAMPCWLINIGLAAIRYGADAAAWLETRSQLGYRPEELYFLHGEYRLRVQGQLLNVRRQVAEIAALADLCQRHPGAVALVDGTLVLTSISRSIQEEPSYLLQEYLTHLDRVRASGAVLASYISRPGATEAVGALRFAVCPIEECDRACRLGQAEDRACGRMAEVFDRSVFDQIGLRPHERSGVWRSGWPTSEKHYREHAVHFFYFDSGPEIARVEVPEWVAESPAALERLHGVLAAQASRGDDGYPRVLIEAHHKAVVTAGDRRAFDALLDQALGGRGYAALSSAKERAKRRRAL